MRGASGGNASSAARVALRWRAPLVLAAVMVGAFAVFHGHAHGTELPQAASPLAYSAGFVISTGLLHLAGVAFGAVSWGYAPIEALRRVAPEREFGTPEELLHIVSPSRTPPA